MTKFNVDDIEVRLDLDIGNISITIDKGFEISEELTITVEQFKKIFSIVKHEEIHMGIWSK